MHNHAIRFVDDDAMPAGTDWALVQCGERNALFIKRGADLETVLAEAWVEFHNTLRDTTPVPAPRQGRQLRRWSAATVGMVTAGAAAVASGGPAAMEGFPTWMPAAAVAGHVLLGG